MHEAASSSKEPMEKLRILVIDDNDAAADGLVRLLNALGAEAQALYYPLEARERLLQNPVDLLFIDIGMPALSGHELIALLRSEGYAGPAIALSGYGQPEDLERSKNAGFTGHYTKPIGARELRSILDMFSVVPA